MCEIKPNTKAVPKAEPRSVLCLLGVSFKKKICVCSGPAWGLHKVYLGSAFVIDTEVWCRPAFFSLCMHVLSMYTFIQNSHVATFCFLVFFQSAFEFRFCFLSALGHILVSLVSAWGQFLVRKNRPEADSERTQKVDLELSWDLLSVRLGLVCVVLLRC